MIGTRYDPATSYRNAQVAERRLGNAVLLTFNSYGHTSTNIASDCRDHAAKRYLVNLDTPPRGTICQPDEVPFH